MALGVVTLNVGSGGAEIVVDVIGGDAYEVIKLAFGSEGAATLVDAANPIPVADAAALAALASIAGEDFATEVTLSTINTKTPSLGQALMAASVPVAIAANQSAVPITGTVAVTGAGDATAVNQATQITAEQGIRAAVEIMDDWDESDRAKVNIIAGQVGVAAAAGSVNALTQRMTLASDDPAVVALQIMDDWDESDRAKVNSIVGQAGVAGGAGSTSASTQRVQNASCATGTVSSVNDSATNVTLLSANTSRVGAAFFNDSTQVLYLKCGATASTTSFTVKIQPDGYFELPGPTVYNGIIDGIWAADGSGAVRVTEYT